MATSAADAADAAATDRLIGVLVDAPTQLWARPNMSHSGHPLLLEATQRHVTEVDDEAPPALTAREIDLLRLLPLSLAINQLAERLFVSVSTVKWHRANLYRKLGVQDRQAAIAVAIERGLLDPSRRSTGSGSVAQPTPATMATRGDGR